MVSLMSDSRVMFLLWFIGVAVVVAGVLIFVEIRLKRRRAIEAAKRREKTPVDLMKIALAQEKSIRVKLDIIGKTAKNYFKEAYGMELRSDYSELAKEFEARGQELEVEFCTKMFEAYYSDKKLTGHYVDDLVKMLSKVYKHKKSSRIVSNVPGFGERMDRFLEDVTSSFANKIEKRVNLKSERLERDARVAARQEYELMSWVKKAVRMGYDKMNLMKLLDDGKRSKKDVKKALKIYDSEAVSVAKDAVNARASVGDSGVAQRIIKTEENRLKEEEVLGAGV